MHCDLSLAKRLRWWIVLITVVCISSSPMLAEEYACQFTPSAPTIDGSGQEEVWQKASVINNFRMAWLGENGKTPSSTTEARLLWDRDYVYIWARLKDADLFANIVQRDGKTWENDAFEIFLKPSVNHEGYYEFHVTPANTQLDLYFPRRSDGAYEQYKTSHKFDFDSAVTIDGTLQDRNDQDRIWELEARIAWKSFSPTGGRPEPGEVWTYALCRYDYTLGKDQPELSSTADLKQFSFHRYEDYSPIRFVGPKLDANSQSSKSVTRKPMVTSKVLGSPEPPFPFTTQRIFKELSLPMPIAIRKDPAGEWIWLAGQDQAYGPAGLYRFRNDPATSDLEVVLKGDDNTVYYDICFHPDFSKNHFVFIGSNGSYGGPKRSRITRYTVNSTDAGTVELDSPKVIIEWDSDGHNGAALTFGLDGYLYVTSGDGTSDSDTNLRGQDLSHLTAKVLRIDVNSSDGSLAYRIPEDNPFVNRERARAETWAYGLRNPWRITTDSETGRIWVTQNGQDLWEQVYLLEKGANYGWSVMEGAHPFYINREKGPDDFTLPVADHHHSEARSLTGGIVYQGDAASLSSLKGAYLYGDYSTGKVWALWHDGKQLIRHSEIADTPHAITGFESGSSGSIWILDHLGKAIYELIPSKTASTESTFPRKLSDTGLFADVSSHKMADGVIPYSVNSPLWSDGAYKARWFAIPDRAAAELASEDRRIEFQNENGWTFPNDTVLIKSFALETKIGDTASRRWIETRLMVRQQNEWVGYSYRWNQEGTDAELVDKNGTDIEYVLEDASASAGKRIQKWHYPSRAECMVCHSRAANYTLGLQTSQMNRVHSYDGWNENQLYALERMGLFKVNQQQFAPPLPETDTAGTSEKVPQRSWSSNSTMLPASADRLPKLVDPYDPQFALHDRVRSYFDANCSSCHVPAGGGNAAIHLKYGIPLEATGLIDVVPKHQSFELENARIVSAGSPDRSVLLKRMATRGNGQMPPLASNVVDEKSVELVRQWILSLGNSPSKLSSNP
ncbi:MAG: hypothetical protein RLY14_452 [Planctomycetota bacterium]